MFDCSWPTSRWKQWWYQGMQEDEGTLALGGIVFYPWNCFSIMIIKSRSTLRQLIIVLKFFMDNASPHCLNSGPPKLNQSPRAQKRPIVVPQPDAEISDYRGSFLLVLRHEIEASTAQHHGSTHNPLWWSTPALSRFCFHPAAPRPYSLPLSLSFTFLFFF